MAVLGDIALVGFRSDDPDSMAFVLLADLSGETITFTDNGWLSAGGFRTGEGTFTYTVPANTPIGTVVTLTNLGGSSLSTAGDQILAYVGTAANPTFLFALDFADGNTSFATNATTSNTSAVPTGLTAGTNALAFAFDNGAYTGSLSGTRAEILANIANPANWTTNDTTGVTYPGNFTITGGGVSAQVTVNDVSITEGDAGTSLLTFTVTRSDASGAFTVDYATANGTATAGSDYVAATGSLSFTAGGALSQTVSVTINGDTLAEANETFSLALSNLVNTSGTAAISDATGLGTITNDDISLVAINAIQGAAHISPLVGQVVTTRGIVTAVDTNGFYIQAADADVDGNDATSEAILVFTSTAPTVAVGDRVQVSGTVTEFVPGGNTSGNLSSTQLTVPSVSVLSSGNALPTAIVLGAGGRAAPTEIIDNDNFGTFDPGSDGIDFYESLEGMRVTVPAPLVVAPTTSFGEIYTVANGGIGATGLSARGTIVTKGSVGDGLNVTNTGAGSDYNPERIQIDDDSFTPGLIPNVAAGTRLNDVTGIVSYGFGNYEVLATSAVTIASASILTGEVTNLDGDADTLTIASYNVLNLDPNDADGDTDIADGRFTSIALQIVNALGTPDIVALQEIQDNSGSANDGTVSASLTLQTLVNAIAANGGPTYSFIDNPFITNNANGGQPGGNIRVAYLYDAARVTLVPGSVATTTNAASDFAGARPPLVATFAFNNENVTVINNHFSSKGGSTALFGATQPSLNGSAADRLVQAQNVANYVSTLGNSAKVVVLGDLNEFTNEESLAPLGAAGLSAMSLTLAATERYSYSFEGNAQELDQVYVSGNLTGVATLDIVHVNSEFVQTANTASDHDPSVLAINIAAPVIETQTLAFQSATLAANEGNTGTTAFTFTVQRSGGTTGQVNFAGTVTLGTANAADFGGTAPTTFSGSIAAGATSTTVTINVSGDTAVEANETFSLTLTSATNNAAIATSIDTSGATASATITNDDVAPPPFGPGDVAFVGFNSDGNDNLALVALKALPIGTILYFSDNEWNGTGWTDTNESTIALTLTSNIAAGSLITLDNINGTSTSSNVGTVAGVAVGGGNRGIANGNETVYVYIADPGTPLVPTAFLAAIANDGFTSGNGLLTGTGLTAATTALDLALVDAGADIAAFNGARSDQTSIAAYLPIINTASNWRTQDASGDQSVDSIFPDVPFSTTAFTLAAPAQTIGFASASLSRSVDEGNSGTRNLTFTVERSGGTAGQLDFTGSFAAGATNAADFGGTLPSGFSGSIAAGASSTTVTVTISGDTLIEASESFSLTLTGGTNLLTAGVLINAANAVATATIVNDDFPLAIGGINVYGAAPSLAGSTMTPVASNDLVLVRLGSIQGTVAGAESIAYENGKVYSTNIAGNAINVHSVTAAGTLVNQSPISLVGLPSYLNGGVNTVDIKNGIIAVGYENTDPAMPGFVALFNAADNSLIKTIQVGILPDDVTFSPDGLKLLVANEGEALSALGTISIIDLSGGAANAVVTNTISFASLNGAESALRDRGLAIAPGQPAAGDIEPEYITISADGTRAYVTLQEVNGVAVIDLTNPTADRPLSIQPLGTVDFSLPGNAIDPSDQDGAGGVAAINIRNVPVQGLLQPDAIATFDVGGVTYFVTANEGDSRVNVTDLVRLGSSGYVLDPATFPNAAALKANANLGRLNVSTVVGDTDGDGDFDVINTIGGRGISIFRQNADGTITKVRETGGEFEAITAAAVPGSFNSNQSVTGFDSRSDDKGPEPEGVSIGVVNGRTYAFVGLERVGGYMVYDVTDPANASFVSYRPQTAADRGPETSAFVSAANSPTGQALLLSAQEISNTVTLYSIQTQSESNDTINGGADAESWNGRGGNDSIAGNGGNDTINGGTGTDTARFAGAWAGYDVTVGGTIVTDIDTANGNDGTDTLTSVELLSFAGVSVAAADAVNDAPIGVNDNNASDALVEDGDSFATGNVLTNDTDADLSLGVSESIAITGVRTGNEGAGGSFAGVAQATAINGIYGQLTINGNGVWGYTLDNSRAATQALNAGQTAIESFTYRVTDAHGLVDSAQLDLAIVGAADPYRLQILHLSDGEAGLLAPTTAPLLAALFDKFEDLVPNSITIAGGDTFIPGPFLAGGTDPSLNAVLNAVAGTTFAASAVVPIASVDTAIHNIIGVEVSGIGNHEWDLGSNVYQASITPNSVAGWTGANYVSLTANLNFNSGGGIPADAINSRFTQTVGVGGLEEASSLKGRVAPSAVVTENGEKIGFVGVITQVLEAISSPTGAEVIGFPFGPGPNGEVDNMALLAAQLQPVIDDLRNQGVNKIVLLSHLQLLNNEKTLAPLLKGVDIILAAGSNTRLGDANDTAVAFPGHAANFADTYPLVLNDADGKTILIVNTDNEYTYLGRLVVDFDANGEIILSSLAANTTINGAYAATVDNVAAAYGVSAANVYTSDAFAAGSKGARVKALTDAVGNVIQVKDGNVFGFSNVYLEGDRTAVRTEESNLGNVTADANADALRDTLGLGASDPVISIKNGGGIRAQIGSLVNNPDGTVTKVGPGSVSQLDVENSLRFDNALMVFDTTAQGIKAILEHSVSQTAPGATPGRFGQIGGISFSFNPSAAVGSRVSDIAIINEDNQIIATLYDNGVLQAGVPTVIKAVTLNFLANGGDSYPLKANGDNFRYLLSDGTLGPILDEALNFESARPANALGEIRALQDYFGERYATPETAFNQADTPAAGDLRIQNTGARTDTVLAADYFLNGNALANNVVGNAGDNLLRGFSGNDNINGRGGNDTAAYSGSWIGYDVTVGGTIVTDIDTANGNDGTDTLISVELLSFAGVSVAAADAVNDAPTGVNDNNASDALVEDGDNTAVGNVLTNDTDADAGLGLGETKTVTGARAGSEAGGGTLAAVAAATVVNGTYGQLTINPDGSWSYALDNARAATQALLAGQTATESFTYRVSDAHGLTDTTQIDLAIGGAYDAGDAMTGTPGNDVITGSILGETINGLAGNDSINGNGGNDLIDGGAGDDVINGGEGSDTASFASAGNGVRVNLGLATAQNTGVGLDRFVSIENLLGSAFDDLLLGNSLDNRIEGGTGNDALFGASGNDILVGGAGNDLLQGGVGADVFAFDKVSNGSVDIITDFYASQGDTLSFGAGVTVTAAYVGFVTTGATVNGQATDNSSRALDLVVTLSSADGNQTVHILDAYSFASNGYWEGMLGIDLSYPDPLPSGTSLVMIA